MRAVRHEVDDVEQRLFRLAFGEEGERVAGNSAVMTGAGQRLVDRVMALQEIDGDVERVVADLAGLKRLAPEFAFARRAAAHRENDGQGDLAFAKIVADLLAELGFASAVIE